MASRSVSVDWYQSGSIVTASVLIKGISPNETVTARFESQHCALHVGDEVLWETVLANCIIPDKSTLKMGRVRAELKLKKADPIQWSDFEAPASVISASPKLDHLSQKTAGVPSPSNSPALCKKSLPPVQNDFVYLNHLRHDCVDTGEEEVRVKVMVEKINKETCSVDFKEGQFELLFQTSDEKFLASYTGSSQTFFVWKVQLYDSIVPNGSQYQVTPKGLNVVLKKASSVKWRALERDKHRASLSNSSLNSNHVSASTDRKASSGSNLNNSSLNSNHVSASTDRKASSGSNLNNSSLNSNHVSASTDRKASSGSNSNDYEMNDLDATDDDASHTSSLSQASSQSSPTTVTMTTKPQTGQTGFNHEGNKSTSNSSSVVETYPPSGEPKQNFHTNPLYTPPTTSTNCQHTTSSSHAHVCVPPSELEMTDPNYRYEQLRQPSLTGLVNQGNTCFMNSVLQCLSNTPELRDFFVSGRYLANINADNPLGFEGKLAKCFSVILRKLWSGEYKYFSPKKLMEIVAKRSKSFDGHSQHDTHEFMSYLIDGLHEDLNRVHTKPITKPVEMEDHADREVAAESWRVHKMRNDSVMVDLFQGQFKSTLVCQECNKESVTFDPFLTLSVPIPKNLRHLPVIFVPQDPYSAPRQLILQLPPEATLKLLKASVARRTSLSMAQLRVFEAYNGKFQSLMSDNMQPIAGIKDSDIIIVSEVLSDRNAGGPVVEVNVVQRVQIAPFPTKCGYCGGVAKEGKSLQRCSKCKAVGYCHRSCQQKDWDEHRLKCGRKKAYPIGLPFVISLPASQLTFSTLREYAERFASRSVVVTRRPAVKKSISQLNNESMQESAKSIQTSNESMQESTESIPTSTESMQESAKNILTSNESMQESAKSIQMSSESMQEPSKSVQMSNESMQESSESIQTCTESMQDLMVGIQTNDEDMQECAESIQEKPMYTLIKVNRFAESLPGETSIEDKGDSPLVFEGNKVYLAMDWRNDPRVEDSVVVTPKNTMDYVEDEMKEILASRSDTVTLTQCLQLFTEPETLSKDEAWYCPRCKEHRQAIKQMSVWKLPQFLVIHLKRFSFHNFVWRSKIDHLVSFPLYGLDMSPYLLGDAPNDIPPETPPIYDLYATVNHYGNIYIGHYVANVKPPSSQGRSDKEEWVCYDDHKVGKIDEDQIKCSEAYVLFYRRQDTSSL